MFALRLNPISRFVRGGWRFRTVLVIGILVFVGLCGWAGVHQWANHHLQAARTAFEKGLFADARAHVRLCLEARADDADAHLLAARIERRLSEFKKAENYLQAYKRIRGVTDEFQTEWILLRSQAGESSRHEQALWNCVQKNHPQSLEILETLAACFLRESRYYAARECLDEWLRRDPKNVLALEWRALVRENLRARDDAIADCHLVLKLAPDRWQVRLQLAHLLMSMASFPEASRQLEILNKTHGQEQAVQLAWGKCLFSQGETDAAHKVLTQLVTGQKAQPPLALYYLGKLEADPAEAVKWFRKVLKLQPANLEARYALHTSLQQARRDKEAAEELRIFLAEQQDEAEAKKLHDKMERDPNNPDLLSKLGGRLLERFDNPAGLHLLNRALSFDPKHRYAHEVLARYYEKHNLPERAAQHRAFSPAGKK
jgi:Tfp pilus assembly protein PilF